MSKTCVLVSEDCYDCKETKTLISPGMNSSDVVVVTVDLLVVFFESMIYNIQDFAIPIHSYLLRHGFFQVTIVIDRVKFSNSFCSYPSVFPQGSLIQYV